MTYLESTVVWLRGQLQVDVEAIRRRAAQQVDWGVAQPVTEPITAQAEQ